MSPRRSALVTLLLAACRRDAALQEASSPLAPTYPIAITCGGHRLDGELAAEPASLRRGLMHRRSLPDDGAMLFVLPEAQILAFSMRHTHLPLTLAALDDEGTIAELADLQPGDETGWRSSRAYRLALEVNQGWLREHHLGLGSRCRLPLPEPFARRR